MRGFLAPGPISPKQRATTGARAPKSKRPGSQLNTVFNQAVTSPGSTKPRSATRLSETMIAHVLGGASIKGTDLECNSFANSLEFGAEELKKACSGVYRCFTNTERSPLKQMHAQLEHCLARQKRYSQLSATSPDKQTDRTLKQEADKLETLKNNLQPGESCLIPGGWSGCKKDGKTIPGHAMLYKLTKQYNGKFSFKLYNSGSGLNAYHTKHGDKYACSMTYHDVESQTLSPSFFKDLVQLRISPNWSSQVLEKQLLPNPKTLYETILAPLTRFKINDSSKEIIRAGQQSQTCTWECLTLWEEDSLDTETFNLLSLCTKMYTCRRWQKQTSHGDKITKEIALQLLGHVNAEKKRLPSASKRLYHYHGNKNDQRLAAQAKQHITRPQPPTEKPKTVKAKTAKPNSVQSGIPSPEKQPDSRTPHYKRLSQDELYKLLFKTKKQPKPSGSE